MYIHVHTLPHLALTWLLGIQTRVPCLHSKLYTEPSLLGSFLTWWNKQFARLRSHLGNHVLQLHRCLLLLLLFKHQFRGRRILYCLSEVYSPETKQKVGAVWLQWKPASDWVLLGVWSGHSGLSISFLFPNSRDHFSSLFESLSSACHSTLPRERHSFHVTSQAVLLRSSKSTYLPQHFCQASIFSFCLASLVTVQCHHYLSSSFVLPIHKSQEHQVSLTAIFFSPSNWGFPMFMVWTDTVHHGEENVYAGSSMATQMWGCLLLCGDWRLRQQNEIGTSIQLIFSHCLVYSVLPTSYGMGLYHSTNSLWYITTDILRHVPQSPPWF